MKLRGHWTVIVQRCFNSVLLGGGGFHCQQSPAKTETTLFKHPITAFREGYGSGCILGSILLATLGAVQLVRATNHETRLDGVMAGANGDTNVQFIHMVVENGEQKAWGPQAGETESRAVLVFFDAAGNQVGQFKFPTNAPGGGNSVLIATAAFTDLTGLRADFVMPPLVVPGSGKVCFRGNPANSNSFHVTLCLSYGSFVGNTEGAGSPAPTLSISPGSRSLNRVANFGFGDGTSRNADFALGSPHPTNTLGQTLPVVNSVQNMLVTPLFIDFGIQEVAAGPTGSRSVTISNTAASATISIFSVTLQGAQAGEFAIFSDTGQTSLAPGAVRTISCVFDPTSAAQKNASLRVNSSDANAPNVLVSLQGTGAVAGNCPVPNSALAVAQDACPNAQSVCPDITYSGSLAAASSDGSALCGNSPTNRDVWYRYTAESNGTLTVSLLRAALDTALSAHSGCPGTTNNQLACSDNSVGLASVIDLPVARGIPVFLRISGSPGATGAFQMRLTGPPCFDLDRDGNGISDACEFDFGDAPAPYPTLASANGARHAGGSGLFLGRRWDADPDGQPDATATGDDADGLPSDDDGVLRLNSWRVGQSAAVRITVSAPGVLNAWVDFNADGDWSDPGEQVFVNQGVAAGENELTFFVPANATITNTTFARFRLSSVSGLGFDGPAADGEVEDYLVEILPPVPSPGQLAVRINEVMAGWNGDSAVQFVELEVSGPAAKAWGPQGTETAGRAMLVFTDAIGRQTGRFVFPSNAPAGGNTILVATRTFADLSGLVPDFIMSPEVMPVAGQVSFRDNPDNRHFTVEVALSYGGAGFAGPSRGGGAPNLNALPIMGAQSLQRVTDLGFGLNDNAAFQLGQPTPLNTANQTTNLAVASLPEQGRTLFLKETFRGNGRTCGSCHVPGLNQFGLTPQTIALLPTNDALFVNELNVNVLRLMNRSQPSDLRGWITSGGGIAKVIAGSENTYLVYGGVDLAGTIMDARGNRGALQSFTSGTLAGPTMSNGSTNGLENSALLRHGRALILENIDGFDRREVFRTSPHLMNVALTAPYGLSGEFKNLEDFANGAVVQHFSRSMRRVHGADFRDPTFEELQAMRMFMETIFNPSDRNFDLDRFATTEAQKRGRTLFFGTQGKCSRCHSGPALAQSDGSLPGSVMGVNENFNTGVANLIVNLGLPTEPAGLLPGQSTRAFNTPTLFGVRLTAPFFHDGSASTLEEAVEFYDSSAFRVSPAGQLVGGIPAAADASKVGDLVAFLESLVELPTAFTRILDFGARCVGQGSPGAMVAAITNNGGVTLRIASVTLQGSDATEFRIVANDGASPLAPGEVRVIPVEFLPSSTGSKNATLEIAAEDPAVLSNFSFGVRLRGESRDTVAHVNPLTLDFGVHGIRMGPSPVQSISLSNVGTSPLVIEQAFLAGPDSSEFILLNDPGASALPPGAVRTADVAFNPLRAGSKSAMLRLRSTACSGNLLDVPVSGVATAAVTSFSWEMVSAVGNSETQFVVGVTARDLNGDVVTTFNGTANFSALVSTQVFHADFESSPAGFTIDNSFGTGGGLRWNLGQTGPPSKGSRSPSPTVRLIPTARHKSSHSA
jgi:cytochrome c peroxidase